MCFKNSSLAEITSKLMKSAQFITTNTCSHIWVFAKGGPPVSSENYTLHRHNNTTRITSGSREKIWWHFCHHCSIFLSLFIWLFTRWSFCLSFLLLLLRNSIHVVKLGLIASIIHVYLTIGGYTYVSSRRPIWRKNTCTFKHFVCRYKNTPPKK